MTYLPSFAPAVHLIVVAPAWSERASGWIERELLRFAAAGGNDIDLFVAVVLAGEGDGLAVGGELREDLDTRMCREARGSASGGSDHPKVAAISEDDAVVVDVGEAQKLGLCRERCGTRCESAEERNEGQFRHWDEMVNEKRNMANAMRVTF